MIFFKTTQQRDKEYQDSLKKWYNKRERVFLLFPRWLVNGQLAWLQYVYKDNGVYLDYWCEYKRDGPIYYYLEDKK